MKKLVMATIVALTMAGIAWANGQPESGKAMSNNSMSNSTMSKNSMPNNSMSNNSMSNNSMSNNSMQNSTMSNGTMSNNSMSGSMAKTNTMNSGDSMAKDSTSFYDLSGMAPEVVPFTTQADAEAMAKDHTVIYFFAASWCPICQATYKNLKAHYQDIPDNVRLIVVNYDTASALKTKYGITQQHTFVEIDSQGNQMKIWSGTTTVQSILEKA